MQCFVLLLILVDLKFNQFSGLIKQKNKRFEDIFKKAFQVIDHEI